jgi:hypothetical protein
MKKLICGLPLLSSLLAGAAEAGELEKLHALILPAPAEERWLEVPWLTDVEEARRLALERDKPLFLWEMDGHPLGCT